MIKEGLLAAAAISTLGGAALGATSVAAAQGEPGNGHMSNLVEAIAEHFNVSTDEVQAIFDAEREEMRANMEARAQEKLQEAVDAGTLTQAQADALTEHHAEMESFRESLKDMTEDERQAALEAHKVEMDAWAEENDLTDFLESARENMGNRMGGRGDMRGMRGEGGPQNNN